MAPDLLGELVHLARFGISAWLFTIAGVIMVISRPRWYGSWWLLLGSIVSAALVGFRLIGFFPPSTNVWVAVALEAAETLGFVLAGTGVLLISMRSRARKDERRLQTLP